MYLASNNITFLYELVETYNVVEVKRKMGALYEVFVEAGYLSVNNNAVTFSYTGIAADTVNVICILPKYLKEKLKSEAQFLSKAKQLIKVLKEYQRNVDLDIQGHDFVDYSSNGVNSEISLADFILNDYLRNGLWNVQAKVIINDILNEVLWDYTVENSYPVIANYPYYFDLYSFENRLTSDSILTQIHAWAVSYCTLKYSELLDIITDFNNQDLHVLTHLGEMNLLLNIIEKELRITFDDRRINLLKALAELISASGQYGESVYTLYGKNKFEHIWEAAISFGFKNQYADLKKYISAPKWINELGTIISEKSTVKPDVLRWIRDNEKSFFLIIDAKYYNFKFNDINQKLDNNPGVGDIIKQYFYELILTRHTSSAEWLDYDTEYLNVLVFPGLIDTVKVFEITGAVSIENALINKSIINIYVNPDVLFAHFINQQPFSDIQIFSLVSLISNFKI